MAGGSHGPELAKVPRHPKPKKKGGEKINKTQKYLRQLACHTYDGINWRTNVELVSIAGPSAKGFDKVIRDSPSSC